MISRTVLASARRFSRLQTGVVSSRSFHATSLRHEHFLDASPQVFKDRVREGGDKIVLVDFYADWCGPCKVLSPLLEKITTDKSLVDGVELDLVTVDTDSNVELAQEFSITSLPTVIAFKNGQQLGHFIGAQRIDAVKNFVQRLT